MTINHPIYCIPPFPREGAKAILKQYGDLIQQLGEQRCTGCHSFCPQHGYCGQGLLPVTSKGADCPYYEHRKE